jgi:hypothetical protein
MEVNEKYIQIRGKIAVEKSYDYGQDIPIVVTVVDIKNTDNMDGTINQTYCCKLFEVDK